MTEDENNGDESDEKPDGYTMIENSADEEEEEDED